MIVDSDIGERAGSRSQRGCLAVVIHFFASALNSSTDMPVRVAARIFKRSFIGSFAIASRLPESTVLNGSTFLSSGFFSTSAGTRQQGKRDADRFHDLVMVVLLRKRCLDSLANSRAASCERRPARFTIESSRIARLECFKSRRGQRPFSSRRFCLPLPKQLPQRYPESGFSPLLEIGLVFL